MSRWSRCTWERSTASRGPISAIGTAAARVRCATRRRSTGSVTTRAPSMSMTTELCPSHVTEVTVGSRWCCGKCRTRKSRGPSLREVARDVNCGRRDRRGEDQADRAEETAGADREDEDDERVEAQRRAHRERLDDVLQQAVRENDDDEHDERRRRSLCA